MVDLQQGHEDLCDAGQVRPCRLDRLPEVGESQPCLLCDIARVDGAVLAHRAMRGKEQA
ncbi:hypothetical protein D3C72_2564160 [compost metagenome]